MNNGLSQIIARPANPTTFTLNAMRAFSIIGARDPNIRSLARRIVSSAPARNRTAEINAISNWIRENIRFTMDPAGLEAVNTPEVTLREGAGDCDDMSTLAAALAASVGYKSRFKAIGVKKPSHVYTEIFDGANWIIVDPAAPEGIMTPPPGYKTFYRKPVNEVIKKMRVNDNLTSLASQVENIVGAPVAISLRRDNIPLEAPYSIDDITPLAGYDPRDVIQYRAARAGLGEVVIFPVKNRAPAFPGLGGYDDIYVNTGDLGDIPGIDYMEGDELNGIFASIGTFLKKATTKVAAGLKKAKVKIAAGVKKGTASITAGLKKISANADLMKKLGKNAGNAATYPAEEAGPANAPSEVIIDSSGASGSWAGDGGEKPFYKTPAGMALIGVGGFLALKKLKVI